MTLPVEAKRNAARRCDSSREFDQDRVSELNPIMIVTVDEKRRVALPQPAKPGDTFDVSSAGQTGFLLTRVERPASSVHLQRKDGYLVAVTDGVITATMTRRALDEFP